METLATFVAILDIKLPGVSSSTKPQGNKYYHDQVADWIQLYQ